MDGKTFLIAAPLLVVTLAGCLGDNGADSAASGSLSLGLMDDGPSADLVFEGVWGLLNSTASWQLVVPGNETWVLTGSGSESVVAGSAPAGLYDGVRLAFSSVREAGGEVLMTQNGFDLPLAFQVIEGEETHIALTFSWGDTFFDSQQGRAFTPALKAVHVTEAGTETIALEAQDIQLGGTKAPVARMRVFDETGLQVFESDFVADSPVTPVVANAGNLTFAASASEALHVGSQIETYSWEFEDGTVLEGITVEHPLTRGANTTVRLTVTDSVGGTDFQALTLAIRPMPSYVDHTFSYEGTVSGGTAVACGAPAVSVLPVPAGATPDGQQGVIVAASGYLTWSPAAADLDLDVYDGAGGQVGHSAGAAMPVAEGPGPAGAVAKEHPESFSKEMPGGAAGGDWTVEVTPCLAAETAFSGEVTLTWEVIDGAPGYVAWVQSYDDGHDHQH